MPLRLSPVPIAALRSLTIADNGIEPGDGVPVAQLDFLQALPGLTHLWLSHVYTPHLLPMLDATRGRLEQVVLHVRLVDAPQHRGECADLGYIMARIGDQLRLEAVKRWELHVDDQRETEGHNAPRPDEAWHDWIHNCEKERTQVFVT